MDMRMLLAMFIWQFDAELLHIAQPEPFFHDAFIALRGPLPIRIKPASTRIASK
jgi:hypothetical protein